MICFVISRSSVQSRAPAPELKENAVDRATSPECWPHISKLGYRLGYRRIARRVLVADVFALGVQLAWAHRQ